MRILGYILVAPVTILFVTLILMGLWAVLAGLTIAIWTRDVEALMPWFIIAMVLAFIAGIEILSS